MELLALVVVNLGLNTIGVEHFITKTAGRVQGDLNSTVCSQTTSSKHTRSQHEQRKQDLRTPILLN
jgi:hypothetical protein